ncbi:hypothetical protein HanIR_Chr05g0220671 [Helianthus annuus]|nr:hypothetical protein HanIR_Chr05g0220671 [Helianthus annuus]
MNAATRIKSTSSDKLFRDLRRSARCSRHVVKVCSSDRTRTAGAGGIYSGCRSLTEGGKGAVVSVVEKEVLRCGNLAKLLKEVYGKD